MIKNKIQLNVGSGIVLLKDFINIDNQFTLDELKSNKGIYKNAIVPKGAKFVKADAWGLPFEDNSADYIMSMYLVEHLPMSRVIDTLKEWLRVLKPGGTLIFATTNFDEVARAWTENCELGTFDWNKYVLISQIIYGHQMTEGEYHRIPFNKKAMDLIMEAAGYKQWETTTFPTGAKFESPKGYFKVKKGSVFLCGELRIKVVK